MKPLLFAIACLLQGLAPLYAAPITATGTFYDIDVPSGPALNYNSGKRGGFIVSMCEDLSGRIWVGTEDRGVWMRDPNTPKPAWKQFTTRDGLGDDNAYALACDQLGRIWVGHLNSGVSVWNGKSWKNYGVLDGPLGARVYSIAVSPGDGDIWIATNAGLSRYRNTTRRWEHTVRQDAQNDAATPLINGTSAEFAADQITALAFNLNGDLFAGTQCDGIAVAYPDSDYKRWQVTVGPETLPDTPAGSGLPGSQITALTVAPDDTVYAATTRGLAQSRDDGATWSFQRGLDWKDKLRGLLKPVKPREIAVVGQPTREDYISCLSVDSGGRLWIGYRWRGYEVRDALKHRVWYASASNEKQEFPYLSAILSRNGQAPLLGTYGQGLLRAIELPLPNAPLQETDNRTAIAPFPDVQKAPGVDEWKSLRAQLLQVLAEPPQSSDLQILADDWTTQGDWLGRYGQSWACLSAMVSPNDYLWGRETVDYHAQLGPNRKRGDSLRYWVQWLYSNDRRTLEMPPVYADSRLQKKLTTPDKLRRQSEIDDHGETYPLWQDGPDLYFTLRVPSGDHVLSFYDRNKDGHDRHNRMRDYRFSLRRHDKGKALNDTSGFELQPELARGRIRDFWGGVWKRFRVRGEQTLTLQVRRNGSYNTILAGVFLDRIEAPMPSPKPLEVLADTTADTSDLETLWQRVQTHNAVWASRHAQRVHNILLRHTLKQQGEVKPAQMKAHRAQLSQHFAALFSHDAAEKLAVQNGQTTARQMQKTLRWDGQTPSLSGRAASLLATR